MKKFLFAAVALCFGLACPQFASAQYNNQNNNTSIQKNGGNTIQREKPKDKDEKQKAVQPKQPIICGDKPVRKDPERKSNRNENQTGKNTNGRSSTN